MRKRHREVDGMVNNSTKFEDEITCNAGTDVLWGEMSTLKDVSLI